MPHLVAILGRPNVGKSTLFNRLIGQRKAIVDDVSGVTRDRQYGMSDWNGRDFNVVDTGGFVPRSEDVFEAAIREQVKIAIEEAHILLFMLDVTTGITDLDQEIAKLLRKADKPVFVVVNKVDNANRALEATEFYSLGFDEYFFLSSISGSGTGELLDKVVEAFPPPQKEEVGTIPRLAILGRPNVGKSSLVNALTGKNQNIVTDIAGTTRDTIHTHYNLFGKEFLLVDTAGIRKKAKVHENIEFYSVIRAIRAIDEADVCLLMIDATQGLESQDVNIFRQMQKKKKGIVVLINKWDLINKDTNTTKNYTETAKKKLAPFIDLPVVFISAIEKTRIHKALEIALEVYNNRQQKISTSELNNIMLAEIERRPPPAVRGSYVKIKYITQVKTAPPTFAFFCNRPNDIRAPYKGYLENRLRENFDLTGVPINIFFRKK